MKKIIFFLSAMLVLASCKNELVARPEKLIAEDKMVEIIYDLAILEAMRSQHQQGQPDFAINPKKYIYKKYEIDSIQFAQSNHYYASDMGNYKKMYDKVAKRIEAEQVQADARAKASLSKQPEATKVPDADAPQIK
jgi:uncharacterized protein DUF4296/putative VirB-like lipoprotein